VHCFEEARIGPVKDGSAERGIDVGTRARRGGATRLNQDEPRSDWAVDWPASVRQRARWRKRLAVIEAPLGRLAPAKSHASPSARRFCNTGAMPPIRCQATEFNHEVTILFVDRPIAEPDRGRARRRSRFRRAGMRGSEAPAHRGVGHGGRMRQRAEAVKAAANFSSRHPEGVALTAEHAAARSPRDRPVIIPQPYLPHHALGQARRT